MSTQLENIQFQINNGWIRKAWVGVPHVGFRVIRHKWLGM